MQATVQTALAIVPTPVGVNRGTAAHLVMREHCPHARGGEPILTDTALTVLRLSPRPWG